MLFSPPFAPAASYRGNRTGVGLRRPVARSSEILTRALDIVTATILLIFLGPLMLVVAAAILIFDRGPILFAHRRLGRNGRIFRRFKFRTMVPDAERQLAHLLAANADAREEWAGDFKLRWDPCITAIGRLLRQSGLDKLPQLFNVLRGDMSIVGPRPIFEQQIEHYGRYFEHYSSVKPGLTGLWQISGRGDADYRRRIAMDVSYARNKCLRLDLRILALTLPALLLGRGAS